MREKNKRQKANKERGVALFFVLFALLLLSAIAASLVLMTNTETSVNTNYRNERVADYAAKAGFEEVRARMRVADPGSISPNLPTTLPPNNGSVLYVLNEGNAPGTVQPWNTGSAYMDDELCHDGYAFNGQTQQQSNLASDLRCTHTPNGNNWYTTTTSNAPYSGTSAALPYKWVRVAMKVNCTVQGSQNATAYCVNAAQPAATQVCFNGTTEVLLAGAATCQNMTPSTNPVYVITSLAVSGVSTRKMVQAEVALSPAQPFPYGLYATGNSCPALNLHGGGNTNPFTDSFTSANGGTYGTTNQPTLGDVGANGGVSLSGHAQVGGMIGVPSLLPSPPAAPNPCAGPQGDYSANGGNTGPYQPAQYPGNVLQTIPNFTFPTPPDPVPMPPNTPYAGGPNLVPGTYGAISGSVTLAPGTYNIYSLNLSGQSSITINPPGAVVLNFPSASANPISLAGQATINNTSQIANNLQINYGGTGTISVHGNGALYAVVDAPNASIAVAGNGDTYGRIIARTIDYGGNGHFHYDRATALGPPNNGPFTLISFRDVAY